MEKTSRARRATAITATAVAVAGAVVVSVAQPSVAAAAVAAGRAVLAVDSAAPVISTVSPPAGTVEGGTPVVLTGTGFKSLDPDRGDAVTFGDLPAARIVVLSDTRMVAVSPPGTGNVLIKLTGSGGTSKGTKSAFGYRMTLGAEFDSVPAKATGGDQITVTVTGGTVGATASEFAALKMTALVGGLATKVSWVDAEHVKVAVPATGTALPASVKLLHDGWAGPASTAEVQYYPVVTTLTPNVAALEGGDTVLISGAGFLGVDESNPSAVTIGGVPATSFGVLTDSRIAAVVPAASAGYAAVRVTTPGGTSPADGTPRVIYRGDMAVDISGDQFLRATGGTHVLGVTGGTLGDNAKDFAASGLSVRIGSTKVPATYVDPTHLKVTVPVLTTSSAEVTVYNGTVAGESAALPVVPVVTGLSAAADTVDGGKSVQVKVAGTGLADATDFMFGDYPAVCEPKGSGATVVFTCVVPPAEAAGPVWVKFTAGNGVTSRFTSSAAFSYTDID